MSVVKIRNDADDGWIVVGGGVSVVQQAGAPGTTYPGMLWVDTDADNPGNSIIEDDDNDTKIQCEESADEDIIRFDVAGSEVMNIDSAGIVTKPQQPAFNVTLSTNQLNIVTDGTYYIVQFDTERFDNNGDFNSGTYTFTAPATGKYRFELHLRLNTIDAVSYLQISFVTSNKTYETTYDVATVFGGVDPAYFSFNQAVLADMDTNDTCSVQIKFGGPAADQTDIQTASWFSGSLDN
jgi:hypothetical protein